MVRFCKHGNTVTEYGLILACLSVLLIASLSLLGDATAGMLASIEKTFTDENNDIQATNLMLQKQGTQEASINGDNGGEPYSLGAKTQNKELMFLLNSNANGATNATSIDGNSTRAKVDQNMKLLQQLKKVLAESNNPALQSWAQDHLIRRIQWLTASEGYAAGIQNFRSAIPESAQYNQDKAVTDIASYKEELNQIMQGKAPSNWVAPKPANVDPATWNKISSIVGRVSNNAQALSTEVAPDKTYTAAPWKAVYNIIMPNETVTTSAIRQAEASGELSRHDKIDDTVKQAVQLQQIAPSLLSK